MKIQKIIYFTSLALFPVLLWGCFNSCPKSDYKTLESLRVQNCDASGIELKKNNQPAEDYLLKLTISHHFVGQSTIVRSGLFPAAYARDDCGYSGRLGLKYNIVSFGIECDTAIDGIQPGNDLIGAGALSIIIPYAGSFDRVFRFSLDEWIDLMNNGITSSYYQEGLDMHAVSYAYFKLEGTVPADTPMVFSFHIELENSEKRTADSPPVTLYY